MSNLPLSEFFIEATLPPLTLSTLLRGLAFCSLKQLALYWLKKATPALIEDIAKELPSLEGLTLVQGETDVPVEWAYPLVRFLMSIFFVLPRLGC